MAVKFKNLTIILIMTVMIASPWMNSQQKAHAIFGFDAVVSEALEIARRAALEALKRRLLTMVTDQIINWIEGGGKPLFITDWKAFLSDAANIAIGDLAYDLGLGFICSPFGLQVQLSVLRPPRFTESIVCTLDDIVGNIEHFYDDFRNGGWLAYSESWQPQNNYYGMVLLAMQELNRRTAVEREANLFEALAGGGFIGTRKCDSTGRFCTITTPGSQIGALAAKAIGSDIDYLVNAEDLAVYVGAISDALINRLIRSGAEGLLSLTTPNKPAGGFISDAGACAGLRGSALTNCLAVIRAGENNFADNQRIFLEQIDATLGPRKLGALDLDKATFRQAELVQVLTELRDCQIDKEVPEAVTTGAELRQEQDLLNQMDAELFAAGSQVDSLENSRINIANPPIRDSATITFYFDSVAFYLNEETAREFKENKAIQLAEIQNKVGGVLPDKQAKLQSCRGF